MTDRTYIIDENLSPELGEMFREKGLKAYHINEMKSTKKQRILDDQIRRLAIQKGCVIVTKDDDFVKSYVSRKVPEKMIFIHGLDNKAHLLSRIKEILDEIPMLLRENDFIEINPIEIKLPFSS